MRVLLCGVVVLIGVGWGCATASRGVGPPREYYFSATGDDLGDGSLQRPFRTIYRANELALNPGDRLLFEGGKVFAGNLVLDAKDAGTAVQPVRVGSYGAGRATIDAGEGTGVHVVNAGGVEVSNLVVVGAGRGRNLGSGVEFANAMRGGKRLAHVRVTDVDVSGFGRVGISVHGRDESASGFEGVVIEGCAAHDNLQCGISVGGLGLSAGPRANRDVTIRRSAAYGNTGDPGARDDNTSGSGIFVSHAEGVLIERCAAYENGALSRGARGGPMGIWASESSRVVVQACESHHNRTGGRYDGGGFGFDGGVTHSILQYNYSHDNDGSGYGLYQYPGAGAWHDNTVRYNVSENDGRRNGYAAVHFWDGDGGVRRAWVYHNTLVVSRVERGMQPRGVWIDSGTLQVRLANNVIATGAGVVALSVAVGQRDLEMSGNCVWAAGGATTIDWAGARYASVADWRARARQGGGAAAAVDPRFAGGAGAGRWALRADSPLVDSATNLAVDTGGRDFRGTRIPQGRAADVGAFETVVR